MRIKERFMMIRSYKWYRFWCKVFGHKYTCCNEITKRCSRCAAEGRIPESHPAGVYVKRVKMLISDNDHVTSTQLDTRETPTDNAWTYDNRFP